MAPLFACGELQAMEKEHGVSYEGKTKAMFSQYLMDVAVENAAKPKNAVFVREEDGGILCNENAARFVISEKKRVGGG